MRGRWGSASTTSCSSFSGSSPGPSSVAGSGMSSCTPRTSPITRARSSIPASAASNSGLAVVGGAVTGGNVAVLLDGSVGRWFHIAALPVLVTLGGGQAGDGAGWSRPGRPVRCDVGDGLPRTRAVGLAGAGGPVGPVAGLGGPRDPRRAARRHGRAGRPGTQTAGRPGIPCRGRALGAGQDDRRARHGAIRPSPDRCGRSK